MNMRRITSQVSAAVLVLIVSMEQASALLPTGKPPTPSFDKRTEASASVQLTPERQWAAAQLQAHMPTLQMDYDPVTGSPAWISRIGFLSGTIEEEIQRAGSLGLATNDPFRAIKAFLIENRNLFGHGPEVLSNAVITRDFVTEHNGMRTVVWQQQLDGIPLFEGLLIGHITKRGELVNISSHFLPNIETVAGLDQSSRVRTEAAPPVSARQAIVNALTNIGRTVTVDALTLVGTASAEADKAQTFTAAPLFGQAHASLVWLPMNRSAARLCWVVQLVDSSSMEVFRTLVDVSSGDVLVRQNLTCNYTDASYRVYTGDSPSPFTPGWASPSSGQPPVVSRQLITLPALDATASPNGWINDGDNQTIGNNVQAVLWRASHISTILRLHKDLRRAHLIFLSI